VQNKSKGIRPTTNLWNRYQGSIELKKEQNFGCAICGITEEETKKSFCVDHDHKTGKVRGLLCNNCNHGLGLFKDNTLFLARAINYLKESTDDSC